VTGKDYSGGGLKIEMIEPMRTWKITFNGLLRYNKSFSLYCIYLYSLKKVTTISNCVRLIHEKLN